MGRVRSPLQRLLSAAASAAPEDLPPAEPPADAVRGAAEEIVRRREFQEPPRSLYQRVLDELGDIIASALDAVVGGRRGVVLALVVLAAVAAFVAYLLVRSLRASDQIREPGHEPPEFDERRPAAEWEAEAAAAESRGDWRSALRCRYRALIAGLARAGVVEEVPGRTSGEYRAAFSAIAPAKAAPFGTATDLFERAWYGNQPVGPEETSSFRELADLVVGGDDR